MHQIKFITLLIVFLQIFISLDFAYASSKLENHLKLSKLIDLENPWGMDLIDSDNILITEKKGTLIIYNFLNKRVKTEKNNFVYNEIDLPLVNTLSQIEKNGIKINTNYLDELSKEFEKESLVLENKIFGEVLYRQIAGAVARRIVNYAQVGSAVTQGADAGFIKFGSRVDLFVPLGTSLDIKVGDRVKGGIQPIAHKA